MSLENGRDVIRGVLLLVFAATAYWVDFSVGVALVAGVAVLILQSAFSGWCPADVVLRPLGMKSKLEGGGDDRRGRRAA